MVRNQLYNVYMYVYVYPVIVAIKIVRGSLKLSTYRLWCVDVSVNALTFDVSEEWGLNLYTESYLGRDNCDVNRWQTLYNTISYEYRILRAFSNSRQLKSKYKLNKILSINFWKNKSSIFSGIMIQYRMMRNIVIFKDYDGDLRRIFICNIFSLYPIHCCYMTYIFMLHSLLACKNNIHTQHTITTKHF